VKEGRAHLNSGSVVFGEGEVSDGHVLQQEVEVAGSLGEHVSDLARDVLTTSQQLRGVETSDHCLGHFVDDGGEDALVEVYERSQRSGQGRSRGDGPWPSLR
jgi:hypothetical protein